MGVTTHLLRLSSGSRDHACALGGEMRGATSVCCFCKTVVLDGSAGSQLCGAPACHRRCLGISDKAP